MMAETQSSSSTPAHKRKSKPKPKAERVSRWPSKGETSPTPPALIRLKPDMTLTKMAEDTGISLSHLSRIFGRERMPSMNTATVMVEYLGVTLDDLKRELNKGGRGKAA